jgi:hypothetical protein
LQCFNLHGLTFLSNSVQNILNHKIFVFVALSIWLFTSWSGAHGHMCFDGQEPPVTVHLHAVGDHADHDNSEQHVDADLDLSQPLLIKLSQIDTPLLIAAALLLAILFERIPLVIFYTSHIYSSLRSRLRPPLRAPPAFPA